MCRDDHSDADSECDESAPFERRQLALDGSLAEGQSTLDGGIVKPEGDDRRE